MRGLSLVLKPLSWLYGLILLVRHQFYDRGFFFSQTFHQPVIKIGNLSLGGSGKTPMTIFLAKHYSETHNVYILSRGYGRQSKGFLEVLETSDLINVGDEPLMMKYKLPNVKIFVSEDRVAGIERINQLDSNKKLILLDDSLQHRKLSGGFNILMTEYHLPFFKDELLPIGKLRDLKSRARAADIVVITKTENPEKTNLEFQKELKEITNAQVFYSGIRYLPYKNFITNVEVELKEKVMAIAAIANPRLFYDRIGLSASIIKNKEYRDHYLFIENDVKDWIQYCSTKQIQQIVTTEKDAVKLLIYKDLFIKQNLELVVLPIEPYFGNNDKVEFINKLDLYINQYS